jgi:uncharacterized protein (TIGR03437 family)
VDAAGTLYFSDTFNDTIRKVGSDGIVKLIAGTGEPGFGGDGDDALKAKLNLPSSLVVDGAGNVYFSDTGNHRVRKIGTDGKISTVAGNGTGRYLNDGVPATETSLNRPDGLALDSAGNLYIADSANHRIRKVSTAGIMTTVAGNGLPGYAGEFGPAAQASLNYPHGVYVDASGTMFIADTYNNRIRAVTEDGVIRHVAGTQYIGKGEENIPATVALLQFPRVVVPNGSGGFYVLDTDNSRIRLLTPVPVAPEISRGGVISLYEFGGFTKSAPGSWLEVYGTNLAQGTREWEASDFVDGRAPTSLSGTSVKIGGVPAYLSYVSPGHVNVQIPDTVPTGEQEIVITNALGSSAPYKFTFERTQPGLFAPMLLASGGRRFAGVIRGDGSLADTVRAPRPGDTVTLYGIGFGAVAPRSNAGEIVRSASSVILPLKVYFGDAQATVTYAGLAPGTLGLYQFNVVVPQVAPGDSIPLSFELNGQTGAQTIYTVVGR